jgi:hypothetical protein
MEARRRNQCGKNDRACLSTGSTPAARLHVSVEKGLGADDFDSKAFATNFTDRRIGCRDITVSHG